MKTSRFTMGECTVQGKSGVSIGHFPYFPADCILALDFNDLSPGGGYMLGFKNNNFGIKEDRVVNTSLKTVSVTHLSFHLLLRAARVGFQFIGLKR